LLSRLITQEWNEGVMLSFWENIFQI
jgi:hypothetical protein